MSQSLSVHADARIDGQVIIDVVTIASMLSPFIYFVHLIISHLERWLNAIVVGIARMHASDEIDHHTGCVLHAFSK